MLLAGHGFENLLGRGTIGAGKSTLATAWQAPRHRCVLRAGRRQGVLGDFYADTEKYAFQTQIYLLNRRFQQHQEIIWKGRSAVQDRTIYEDSIFAKMLVEVGMMDERDYRTYQQLFKHMSNFMCRPNLIVYLDVKPDESQRRIAMRGRGVESNISLEYLTALYKEYEAFITDISRVIPVIRVDYERFHTAEEMAQVIQKEYLNHSFLRSVTKFDPVA